MNSSVTKNDAKNEDNIIALEKGNAQIDKPIKNMCCDIGCIIL